MKQTNMNLSSFSPLTPFIVHDIATPSRSYSKFSFQIHAMDRPRDPFDYAMYIYIIYNCTSAAASASHVSAGSPHIRLCYAMYNNKKKNVKDDRENTNTLISQRYVTCTYRAQNIILSRLFCK